MTQVLDGHSLRVEDVVRSARNREPVRLHEHAIARINKCRGLLERKIKTREIMYGVNTGIGELSEVVLTPEQVEKYQRFLLYSHAAGCGDPCAEEDVRAAMLARLNTHCWGHSGIRHEVVQTQVEMLNRGVTPVVCQKGSVGACGDLSPMAQMAITLMGEGEVFYQGRRMGAKQGFDEAGIPTIVFRERDGLASINGSSFITGMGCLQLYDAERWLKTQEVALAMTLEALNANMNAYDPRIHLVRGYPGAQQCAENIRGLTEGSELLKRPGKKVQDAYSLRSSPQVIGAAKDAFQWTRYMLEIELNHAADNPTFFPDEDLVLTGANFQGTPMALGLELLGVSVATVSVLSERRLNRLMNPHLSMGLPAFLTKGAGMFSGLMLSQYTAGALIAESRVLSHPATTGSIPAAADQEDFVSMGMTTAIKTRQIIENAWYVVAIELMAAAQAFDFRSPLKPSPATHAAYEVVRTYLKKLEEDRPLHGDINTLARIAKEGKILEAAEHVAGTLK
ncbi:MAG TPA: aromatic amino acid ammonia-lyase [Candidatus Eremiobacteraceae bacterium]|nr:aromatic amino acid ammonia-lyase [Candidatus Eremiobacteraceae bacterium]